MRRTLSTSFLLAILVACAPSLPDNPDIVEARWLEQNWSQDEQRWFHSASQGTSTLPIPYAWFMALEQPTLWLSGPASMLSDPNYLQRFGFIAALGSERSGTPILPVGFARTKGYIDPATGHAIPEQIGLTCAACHTGHLEYQGLSLRINGAPAMIDLGTFRDVIGVALAYTRYVPGRFDRFASRVLGEDADDNALQALRDQLALAIARGKARGQLTEQIDSQGVIEGFGRLDALNRIGNQVFFANLLASQEIVALKNLVPISAPVNYPPLWDASWFDWVQYDGSIKQPMIRNAGEALGVSARVNLANPQRPLYASSVQVGTIHAMEQLLAGDNPFSSPIGFKGLRAPSWPENILGRIDAKRSDHGRRLYQTHCEGCHLPAVDDPGGRFWSGGHWSKPNEVGERYLQLKLVDVSVIGTDPAQARVLSGRTITLPPSLEIAPGTLCGGTRKVVVKEAAFGVALAAVTAQTVKAWYEEHAISDAQRAAMDGHRPNCIRTAPLAYKARPLDGIWATPPFLHNGSVPSLWALLSPLDEGARPRTFCLGSRRFDPKTVGIDTGCREGFFKMDTTISGNHNTGHEFADKPRKKGVIGPRLDEEERWALIEFLKAMRVE